MLVYKGTLKVQRAWAHIEYVHNSTDAFKAMNPKQKNCYLPKCEKQLKMFEEYSEADCMLECAWDLGTKLCQCIPWYLSDKYPNDQVCEVFGNRFVTLTYRLYTFNCNSTTV